MSRRVGRGGVALAVAGALVLGGAGWGVDTYLLAPQRALSGAAEELPRVDGVFDIPETERPATSTAVQDGEAPTTFLLVGSDSRGEAQEEGDGPWQPGQQRSDVIVLGQVGADGEVALVSVPRDSWVDIPGRGPGKVNAAFSYGGPSLLVRTLEAETGVRIDHYAVIDFGGLVAVTDAIGGVDVASAHATSYDGHQFVEGTNHLDGDAALAFVRQRKNLPNGDLDRVRNQQRFLRAMFGQALSRETATDPDRLEALLDAALDHVAVDDSTSQDDLRTMAAALGGTPSSEVVAGTAPVAGLGREGSQSVVHLDRERGEQVWQALRDGEPEALRDLLD